MIEKKEILEEMNNRSREVFRRVVEGYLTDGEPVGSRTLSREFSEDISAATIRNVMQDLEFLGLLGSPHTSAGRIPTQQGLRMFVDGILEVSEVDKNDRKKIDKIVSDETNQVDDILDDISTTLSGVTQGASLVLTPKREAPIKHVEFLPLSISQALVVLVYADGHVENRLFKPPPGQTPSSMKEAANFLNAENNVGKMMSGKVSPTIADDIKQSSFWAILGSLIVVFLYILVRFKKWQFSLGAVAAVFHDVLIVLGIFSLTYKFMPFSMEIDQAFIAAILTVIGYSLNDTVVVFDRIREFLKEHSTWEFEKTVNSALNSTLSRTLNTSFTTLVVLLAMFTFGADSLRGLLFALIVGVLVGTYSSVFVATPIMKDTLKKYRD
mgnify:CR=1 FL=1